MNFDGGVQFMKWGKQSLDQCFYFDIWCAMKLTLWFLLGNVGLENLDPLFCFDSGEGDLFPLMLCFFFF